MTRWFFAWIFVAALLGSAAPTLGQDTTTARRLRVLVTNDDGFQAACNRNWVKYVFKDRVLGSMEDQCANSSQYCRRYC